MKIVLSQFEEFFEHAPYVEKLFNKTKELLDEASVAVSNQKKRKARPEEISRALELVETCLNEPEKALENFETFKNEKYGYLEPEQAIELYGAHLRELEKNLQEKEAVKKLDENWKRRRIMLEKKREPHQEPMVPLSDMMSYMFQMFSTFQQAHQVQQSIQLPVAIERKREEEEEEL